MPKAFRAFRFDPELYAGFKELVSKSGYTVTGALERFMACCVEGGVLAFPVGVGVGDVEAEVRILLDWLGKGEYWYRGEGGEEVSIQGRLLALLPKVHDVDLKKTVEEGLKRSVKKGR